MIDVNKVFFNVNIKKSIRKTCKDKIRYKTYIEAKKAVINYTNSILFSNMDLYYCNRHDCYHLGHNQKMDKNEVTKRSKNNWEKLLCY